MIFGNLVYECQNWSLFTDRDWFNHIFSILMRMGWSGQSLYIYKHHSSCYKHTLFPIWNLLYHYTVPIHFVHQIFIFINIFIFVLFVSEVKELPITTGYIIHWWVIHNTTSFAEMACIYCNGGVWKVQRFRFYSDIWSRTIKISFDY